MKLGIGINYSGAKFDLPFDLVKRAEEMGFYSVSTAETYGSDAITPLAYLAAITKKIKLFTSIAQLAARTPANLAMCAQTIDAMAGGNRMLLGIGVSGPQIVEGWYGQPWGKPNYLLRDYVAIIKKILQREAPLSHEGKAITIPYPKDAPGSSGLGKPLKSILHGNPDIPVYLGTATPVNIRMTAEVADGWLAMDFLPGDLPHYRPLIEEGLAKRKDGLRFEQFPIWTHVHVHMHDDVKAAIDARRAHTALYVGGMGAKGRNFHNNRMIRHGYAEAAARIQELYLAGRKREAEAAVPADYIDNSALLGPPQRLRERLKRWTGCGLAGLRLNSLKAASIEAFAGVDKG